MSKLNQIQNAILQLDGGAYQKLCDTYLHRKRGYDQINSIGSVIASDKVRRGTPDAFVPLANGKYVLAEYTTQETGLFDKLSGDLAKCFDPQKCGIDATKIEEIIFCHTTQLTLKQHDLLREECQSRGVNLNIFGIVPMSCDLYQKYPGLARDFLQIEVDTGQILSQEDFVSIYDRNKGVTPLRTTFRFRENELSQICASLDDAQPVLITGAPGVGKSRLALECCTRFVGTHPEYRVCCILNRGPDLFEDLRVHFSEPGKYLIFVDDANRVSRFEYVTQLLRYAPEQVCVKILATVRDYAIAKVRAAAQPFGGAIEVNVKPLEGEQIRNLVKEEYGITNPYYLERIDEISRGNPRLAMMAAQIAKRENKLSSIANVTALYDEYYESIRRDVEDIQSPLLLQVGALIAFFRVIDRTHQAAMEPIAAAFGITYDDFWLAVLRLHELEVVDIHEDEAVRISDQVLGTYLFYLAFFKKRTLDFSKLLTDFFPACRRQLADAVYPMLDAFDSKKIVETMRRHVEMAWHRLERMDHPEDLLSLMGVFWFVKETDTLLCLGKWIEGMEPQALATGDLNLKPAPGIESPSILKVLSCFRHAGDANAGIAVRLLLDYLLKRPDEAPRILYILLDTFAFMPIDRLRGFAAQRAVVDALWDRAQLGDGLLGRVFLTVARAYLHTEFSTTHSASAKSFTITKFTLPATHEVKAIRERIWRGVFSLYERAELEAHVLALLAEYARSVCAMSVREIIADDARQLLPFLESTLNPAIYLHCLIVQDYLRFLEEHDLPFDKGLRDRFKNDCYRVTEVLLEDFASSAARHIRYEVFCERKKQHIREFCAAYSFSDYVELIRHCTQIRQELNGGHVSRLLPGSLEMVFLALAERDTELYIRVLRHYLTEGDVLALNSFPLVRRLVELCGPEAAYQILTECNCSESPWMAFFFQCLSSDHVTERFVRELHRFYEKAPGSSLPYGVDFLLNYRGLCADIFPRITRILLQRSKKEPMCVHAFSMLFNPSTEANKVMLDIFAGYLGVLKEAYIAISMMGEHDDYDGHSFNHILDTDPSFLIEYIDATYQTEDTLSWHEGTRDYSLFWKRDDCETLGRQLVERLYEWEVTRNRYSSGGRRVFFSGDEPAQTNPSVAKGQDTVVEGFIEHRHDDAGFMRFIFLLISEFAPERRLKFIAQFLGLNKSYELFTHLEIEPLHWSWGGSAVPMFQKRVEYLESILPLLDTADFLRHKQLIEHRIQGLRAEIEREKKSDFIDADE